MAVWLVIGGPLGLPACVVEDAVKRGHKVIALKVGGRGDALSSNEQVLRLSVAASDEGGVDEAWNTACAWEGIPDVVIFAHSVAVLGAAEEISEADLRSMLTANVVCLHAVLRASLASFRRRRRGRYIVVGAARQLDSAASPATYDATMLAAEGLAEAVAAEAWDFGIRMTIVEPVGFSTHQLAGEDVRLASGLVSEYEQSTAAVRTSPPAEPQTECQQAAAQIASLAENPRAPMRTQIARDGVRPMQRRTSFLRRRGRAEA
jgi:NAD(P)-dependent dehydrogenase (short-subunit alcohol dehydrogenase family)